MPGTQLHGTHAFNPSSRWATEMLNTVNVEEDGAEDQLGPLEFESPISNMPAAHGTASNPHINPNPGASSSGRISAVSESSESFTPPNLIPSSSSSATRPLASSSLPPSVYRQATHQSDASMGSAYSIAASDPGQKRSAHSITASDPDSDPGRKRRKSDGRSVSGTQLTGSKKSRKKSSRKTDDLNPVIISSTLNSTLNRMADVMERSLDVTATSITHTTPLATAPTTIPYIPPPAPASLTQMEILDQAIRILSASDGLTDNEVLAASLFFTSGSVDAVCAAQTFIGLGSKPLIQLHFLREQLKTAAPLSGKGKGKAMEGDNSMMY